MTLGMGQLSKALVGWKRELQKCRNASTTLEKETAKARFRVAFDELIAGVESNEAVWDAKDIRAWEYLKKLDEADAEVG